MHVLRGIELTAGWDSPPSGAVAQLLSAAVSQRDALFFNSGTGSALHFCTLKLNLDVAHPRFRGGCAHSPEWRRLCAELDQPTYECEQFRGAHYVRALCGAYIVRCRIQ